jgi:hypothetical protein
LAVYSRRCRSAFWLTVQQRTYVSTYIHQYVLHTHTHTHIQNTKKNNKGFKREFM